MFEVTIRLYSHHRKDTASCNFFQTLWGELAKATPHSAGRALIHIYLTVCSVRYKLGDARCDDVWLKYDGKGSFLLIGELETSPIWLASARHSGLSSEDKNTS